MHEIAPAYAHSSGPLDAKIILVGEAWGANEEEAGGIPFIGAAGQELTRLLRDAEISRGECFITNTLAFRPEHNNLQTLCGTKKEMGKSYPPIEPFNKGKYLRPEYLPEIVRLKAELQGLASPHIAVALGGSACWALLGSNAITARRGFIAESTLLPGLKVLPTYHPSYILQNYKVRLIAVMDLIKARKESLFPEIRYPRRNIIINPTLDMIRAWWDTHKSCACLSVDIETRNEAITCIGFASSPSEALVIPFWNRARPEQSYWPDIQSEALAWGLVRAILASPTPKLFHNGIYDVGELAKLGFHVSAAVEDTMLLQHSLFPEMLKGLGFLGSIYTSERPWKLGRTDAKDEAPKAEEA